jgi:hypothetical protein
MNLTFALAGLGVLLLAAVWLHGVWLARRASPKKPAPLVHAVHKEPVFDSQPSKAAPDEGHELCLSIPPVKSIEQRIDVLLDAVVSLTIESAIKGAAVLHQLGATRRVCTKPFFIEGLNPLSQAFEPLQPDLAYNALQLGIQLANRSGPLNEIEYSEFIQKVQHLSEQLNANIDFPDMFEVMAKARELDAFASQYDAQLAMHLCPRSIPWSMAYLQQHAAAVGLTHPLIPGRLGLSSKQADRSGVPMVVLTFDAQVALADDSSQAALRDAILNFDVPQTPAAAQPLEQFKTTLQTLAKNLDAKVLDDAGQAVNADHFDHIATELARVYNALEQHGFEAGSMLARRLFS